MTPFEWVDVHGGPIPSSSDRVTCTYKDCGWNSPSLAAVIRHQRSAHGISYRTGRLSERTQRNRRMR